MNQRSFRPHKIIKNCDSKVHVPFFAEKRYLKGIARWFLATILSVFAPLALAEEPGAIWHFDEGVGTTAYDSLNDNHGTVSEAVWTSGKEGGALSFTNGTTSNVSIPRSVFDGFGNTAYLEAWVFPTDLPSLGAFVFRKRGAFNDWELYQRPDGRIVTTIWGFVGTGGKNGWQAVGVVSLDPVPLDTWTKLASWYDGTTLTLYINDEPVASDQKQLPLIWDTPTCPSDVYFEDGCYYGTWIGSVSRYSRTDVHPGSTFSGKIDEVRVGTTPFSNQAPSLVCQGFQPPLAGGSVTARGNRALPVKGQLFDALGFPITDLEITAPPVIQVSYQSASGGEPQDVTGDALPAGMGTEGNEFEYNLADQVWQFNLKTKNYTAAGTYTISMVSGDSEEYAVNPTCEAVFVKED